MTVSSIYRRGPAEPMTEAEKDERARGRHGAPGVMWSPCGFRL